MGFFNVVVEESLSDANMTALTFLSVVFGTTESPTGSYSVVQIHVVLFKSLIVPHFGMQHNAAQAAWT